MRLPIVFALCLGSSLAAGEAPPGAHSCSGCHAATGQLSLGGLTAQDISAAMVAFRDGTRAGTLMPRLAAGFDDGEITAIAAWIAEKGDK